MRWFSKNRVENLVGLLESLWIQSRRFDGKCGNEQNMAENNGEKDSLFANSSVRFSIAISIRFLSEYKKRGYNANQDVPSTLYWREFVTHCPRAKVILTVRDSGEQWFESRLRWVRSLRKYSIGGIFPFWLLLFLMSFGFMGKTAKRQMKISKTTAPNCFMNNSLF